MEVVLVTLKLARTYLHEGDTVAVVRVHVGVNLEDEARQLILRRLNKACGGRCCAWRGGNADEALQQLANTKVINCRAEEYWGKVASEVVLTAEGVVDALNQVYILAKLVSKFFSNICVYIA